MQKNIIIIVLVVILLLAGYFIWQANNVAIKPAIDNSLQKPIFDPLNATYNIDRKAVKLQNGKAEQEIVPGSSAKLITQVFGQPSFGDLNADGLNDASLIVAQDTGGSGTFFYVAVSLNNNGAVNGTNAILLGDRIAPQNMTINNGEVVVNYAERKSGEPFTTPPSVGITKKFLVSGTTLLEDLGK